MRERERVCVGESVGERDSVCVGERVMERVWEGESVCGRVCL